MKVLVCGSNGFIGCHIATALERGGHEVVRTASPRRAPDRRTIQVDFAHDIDPATWRERLRGIDAVVNAVGVLRDSRRRPMQRVHADVPAALFAACAQSGVHRVVQVSALGIEPATTAYARTKLAAERCALTLAEQEGMAVCVVRPSVVYGPGGASAALFDTLSRLPCLVLPAAVQRCRVQPVHVDDVARLVCNLVSHPGPVPSRIDCVGPRPMALADFISCLRAQRGHRPAVTFTLPHCITRWSAKVGDAVPLSPWGTQALALLATDNTAEAAACMHWLGSMPRDPSEFAGPKDAHSGQPQSAQASPPA